MKQELEELNAERKILKSELIRAIELIKTSKNSQERKELFAFKNEIAQDIKDIDDEIKELTEIDLENKEIDSIVDEVPSEIVNEVEVAANSEKVESKEESNLIK